jgi:hypothetical protein
MGSFWEDAGNFVSNTVDAVGSVIIAPIQVAGNLVSGRDALAPIKSAAKKATGVAVQSVTGYGLLNSDPVNKFLTNPTTEKWTAGVSTNYAGFNTTAGKLANGADPTQADWDRSRKFLMDVAVVGAGGLATQNPTANALAKSAWTTARGASTTNLLVGASVGQSLLKGDIKGAVGATGAAGFLNNYLPGSGNYLNNLLPDGGTYKSGPNASGNGGASDSNYYGTQAASGSYSTYFAVAAVVGVAYLVARRMR